MAIGAGTTVATVEPVAAAPGDSSNASARFLSGSLLAGGSSLDLVAALAGVSSSNTGVPAPDTDTTPLDLSALSLGLAEIPGGLNVGLLGNLLQLGVANQYSQASDNGVSRAASGAVGNNGVVSLNGSGGFPAGASIDVTPLLAAAGLNTVIDELSVSLGAITGVAALNGSGTTPAVECVDLSAPVHCRGYSIANGTLTLSSPTVAALTGVLVGAGGVATTVDAAIATLVGPNGLLAGVLASLNAALSPLLGNPGLDITITTDIAAALNTVLTTPIGDGVVRITLGTGLIEVNLDALLTSATGDGIDELNPNTEILSGPVLADLVSRVATLLNTVPALVGTALTTTLNAATLHIAANICIVGSGATCTTPIVDIGTGIQVAVDGTLFQILNGSGATASITVKVAGLPIVIPVASLLTALSAPINSVLFGPTGAVATAVSTVGTAVAGIVTTLSPALSALNTIVSLLANVQEAGPTAGSFREVALRATLISLLGGSAGVARIDLGRAVVGANAVLPTAASINPTSGPTTGGQTVTVAGTGFVPGATSVTIGGNAVPAASVTVVDPTTLTFVTPAHPAGAVPVVVSSVGGDAAPLTYTYVAAPSASSLTPINGPIAGGTIVTITGTNFIVGQTTVTIGGNLVPAGSVTVDSSTSLTFPTPAHAAGSVSVITTTPGGSSGPLGYTYLATPVGTSLTPTAGPTAGGTAVTVSGSGFVAGQTTVTIDTIDIPAGSVTVNSATSLTFTTPAHAAGPVPVTVTTPGGDSPPLTYTYVPVPNAATLSPSHGPVAGGTAVTVTGAGFVLGATTVTVDGTTIPAGSVTVNSATSLTFSTPAHAAGLVAVTVATPGGTSSPALDFTYVPAPTASSLAPTEGPTVGGTAVTITGTGFVSGETSVVIGGNLVPTGSVTVDSATSLTLSTPAHAAGSVAVTVVTPGGTSAPLTYTYLPAPGATSLSPAYGPIAGGTVVAISGNDFVAGLTTVTIDGTTIPAASVTVNSATSLTFSTPAHTAGPVPVSVGTPGGTSGPLGYTYVDAPEATSLTPTHGPIAGGTVVTVTGTGFVAGETTVTVDGNPVAAVVLTATTLTFATPAHPAGPVPVTVITPGGSGGPLAYTYVGTPTAASLSPDSGPTTGGQAVTVTGSNFVAGQTSVTVDGITIPAGTVTVDSATSLTFATPAHAAGSVGVTVTAPGGTSAPLTYTYVPVPGGASLTPTHGPTTGGTAVTITGTDFVVGGTTVTVDGTTIPAGSVTVVSATELTFATPAHPAGPVDVTVTTPGGISGPALVYTYLPAPDATALSPHAGPVAGGQTVAVTGSGFVAGLTSVTIDGITIPAAAVTVVSATGLTFVTPAHTAGLVAVTVTTPGGSTAPLDYTYLPAPATATIDPTHGPVAGGQTITITDSGFVPGATWVAIGADTVAPADVTVALGGLSLTFVTPAHPAGPVPVTVTTLGGTSDPALGYTYVPVATATSLLPAHGPVAGGQAVTVTGSGFVPSLTTVTIGGIPVAAVVVDASTLTFVTPAHADGLVGVTVTTPGGTTDPALDYTYVAVPTAFGIVPDHGPEAGGTSVVITGTGFVAGQTWLDIGGIVVPPSTAVTVTSSTTLTFITPPHPAGPVGITVTTPGGTTSPPMAYTYEPTPPPPTTVTITPDHGPEAGGTTVVVVGADFVPGQTSIRIGGTEIAAEAVAVDPSGTQLSFVTPAHVAGSAAVTATTAWGTSNPPLAFAYGAATLPADDLQPPVITSPANGSTIDIGPPPISGTGRAGATVTVTEGGAVVCTAAVSAGGNWGCLPSAMTLGTHTIVATQTSGGVTSGPSDAVTFSTNRGELPRTGNDPGGPLSAATLLLLGGFGLRIITRRRRHL